MRELTRLVALAVGALLAGYPWTLVRGDVRLTGLTLLALAGVLSAAALWSETAITLGAIALAAQYLTGLTVSGIALDPFAPAYAAVLLVWVDLTDLALSLPAGTAVDRGLVLARLRAAGMLAVVGLVAGTLVLVTGLLPYGRASLLRSVGLLAALLGVAAPLLVLRRRRPT